MLSEDTAIILMMYNRHTSKINLANVGNVSPPKKPWDNVADFGFMIHMENEDEERLLCVLNSQNSVGQP